MSIISIISNAKGDSLLISTLDWFDKMLHSNDDSYPKKEKLYEVIFDIRTPFLMDGEAEKLSEKIVSSKEEKGVQEILHEYFMSKGGKKCKLESALEDSELEVLNVLAAKFECVRSTAEFQSHFKYVTNYQDFLENNRNSRTASNLFLTGSEFPLTFLDETNNSERSCISCHFGRRYLIPPRSRYVMADVFSIEDVFPDLKFNFVVMDPPWRNKHVSRRKNLRGMSHSYETMDVEALLEIRLGSLLSDDAFVFVWITNNRRVRNEFVKGLHRWGLEAVATWYWLKVTRSGEPVVNFGEASVKGKLPFERVIVARKRRTNSAQDEDELIKKIQNVLILSIPSSVHSHKPPLKEALNLYFPSSQSVACLELFARSLTPGWTSVGKEVLRFQDIERLTMDFTPPVHGDHQEHCCGIEGKAKY